MDLDGLRSSLADRLTPLGFEPRAQLKSFVRKRGGGVHRVVLGAGRAIRPSLVYEDAPTRKLEKGWTAGGPLGAADFGPEEGLEEGIASSAAAYVDYLVKRVRFFDLFDVPEALLGEVSRRYVPGFLAPRVVIPFLRARVGASGVSAYAAALLAGRPELAPAYATVLSQDEAAPDREGDHGTQLACGVRAHGADLPVVPPATVQSKLATSRHLRCFFGRQLRAWGETEAAHLLARVGDEPIQAAYARQKTLGASLVDRIDAASLVLELATGEKRAPRRAEPKPRLFQYHARMAEPFA